MNVCTKDLHWNQQNSYCETKLAQQKPCFEFKMFEWMSWSETKFLNKSLAAKPNSANKILVSNSKCLNESLAFKLTLWRKVLLRNQTPTTKFLFQIQNFWITVFMWNQNFQEKSCFGTKLCQEMPCFEFKNVSRNLLNFAKRKVVGGLTPQFRVLSMCASKLNQLSIICRSSRNLPSHRLYM